MWSHRLKPKVKTIIVLMEEPNLDDAEAYILGESGAGAKLIAPVLNLMHIHSVAISAGPLSQCFAIAAACSRADIHRQAVANDSVLHVAEFAKVNVTHYVLTHMLIGTMPLGGTMCEVPEEEAMWSRLTTPVVVIEL